MTPLALSSYFAGCRFEVEPICPKELVYEFTAQLRSWKDQGSSWAKEALLLQPCDFWKILRGRTTWIIGDSVTEVYF